MGPLIRGRLLGDAFPKRNVSLGIIQNQQPSGFQFIHSRLTAISTQGAIDENKIQTLPRLRIDRRNIAGFFPSLLGGPIQELNIEGSRLADRFSDPLVPT